MEVPRSSMDTPLHTGTAWRCGSSEAQSQRSTSSSAQPLLRTSATCDDFHFTPPCKLYLLASINMCIGSGIPLVRQSEPYSSEDCLECLHAVLRYQPLIAEVTAQMKMTRTSTSASFAFRLKQSWAINSLDAEIGVFESSYTVLLPSTYMVMC